MHQPELEILHRDQYIVAINKPAGLLVHRSTIDFHEQHNALDQLKAQIDAEVFPVHRLDKPTSGVLLFALDREYAALISEQFRNQKISKRYLAVVRGHTDEQGTIDNPVRDRDAPGKPRKDATTSYKTLAHIELAVEVDRYPSSRYSVVEVTPLTGRRHQIRQHMKHISHPIIGDTSYGKSVHNKFFHDHFACQRLLLHAQRLTLTHRGTECTIEAGGYDQPFRRVITHGDWIWTGKI